MQKVGSKKYIYITDIYLFPIFSSSKPTLDSELDNL